MSAKLLARLLAVGALLSAATTSGAELPPANPYLAQSHYAVGHGDSAQQDSLPMAGPTGPSRRLGNDEIDYVGVGPGFFGALTSGPYSDGKRVFWGNGLDRVVKIDHHSFRVLATYPFPGVHQYSEAEAEASIARFDANNEGLFATLNAFRDAQKLRDLAGVYTLLDRDNIYYIGNKDGSIVAYGDAEPGVRGSAIVELRRFQMPASITGTMVGMNMTYDGWLVVATEHGYLVAVRRDFGDVRSVRLLHSEGAENKGTGRAGYGWVRNGVAIDSDGGIYIASQEHMHKVVWNGERLSTEEADGAWAAPYLNGWGHGTGATPSLMGFGEEDRFVVITDGEPLMNLVLFWRDAIPEDWQALPGAPSRRIAGMLPANMGNPALDAIQSEQSVVVAGYGALVVNNIPRNVPWYLPKPAETLLVSFLGSNPRYQPYGVQKFEWNAQQRQLENAWVNREVSSPNCVPIVSHASDAVYLIGARDNEWTLEALDWRSGQSRFYYVIGGQRYNSLFAGTLLDEDGRVHYGTTWGRTRLNPR